MQQNLKTLFIILVITLTLTLLLCTEKKQKDHTSDGNITSIAGNVQIYKVNSSGWEVLTTSTKIESGDSIKTASESQVEIRLSNESSIKIQESSKIVVPIIHKPK